MNSHKIYCLGDKKPNLHPTVYVADGAKIIGQVEIGENSSVWFNVVIRGDVDLVQIGADTNIQDGCVLHEDAGFPLVIGDQVTVGHNAILHGCQVGSGAMVGMGAIILNGAKIGAGSVVAAGSLVPPGKEIPPRTMAMGSPARVVRSLTDQDVAEFGRMAKHYCQLAKHLKDNGIGCPE